MTSYKDSDTLSATSEHLLGRVKWFNNKAGYGFIVVTDGIRTGTDIFVHHSSINVDSLQYKYLIQGEYVEFDLVKTNSSKHEWQAANVSGIRNGQLMCETRHELKIARNEYKSHKVLPDTQEVSESKTPRQRPPVKETIESLETSTSRPRQRNTLEQRDSNKKQWTLVRKNSEYKTKVTQPARKSST
jgi:cold shock CspA family protein